MTSIHAIIILYSPLSTNNATKLNVFHKLSHTANGERGIVQQIH